MRARAHTHAIHCTRTRETERQKEKERKRIIIIIIKVLFPRRLSLTAREKNSIRAAVAAAAALEHGVRTGTRAPLRRRPEFKVKVFVVIIILYIRVLPHHAYTWPTRRVFAAAAATASPSSPSHYRRSRAVPSSSFSFACASSSCYSSQNGFKT